MTRQRKSAIAVVAIVIAAGTITWAVTRSDPTNAPPTCDVPASLAPRATAAATGAPDNGSVRVVEQGFTQLEDGVSLGAILENTSALVAYRTRVTLRVLDAAGQTASAPRSAQLVQEVPIILPGRRIGVGAFAFVADAPQFTKAKVARFEVGLGQTQWWPRDAAPPAFSAVDARFLGMNRHDPSDPAVAIIDYSLTSAYCEELIDRGVSAIYRDSQGAIVGGTIDWAQTTSVFPCSPGTHDEWISTMGHLPSTVDQTRTQIFAFCDLAPKAVTVETEAPWN